MVDEELAEVNPSMPENGKKDVLSYLKLIATAARTLARDGGDMDTEDEGNLESDDCQTYLDQIARDLLTACQLERISLLSTEHLPTPPLSPVDLERDLPRDESTVRKWQRADYLRNMLRAMAPIAMDVAAQICSLVASGKAVAIKQENAEASFVLFSIWLPVAPHLAPLVLDLFSVDKFPCPLTKAKDYMADSQTFTQQYRILLLAEASQALCHTFFQRGEIKILLRWWNWSVIFVLMTPKGQQDTEMTDVSQEDSQSNNNNEQRLGFPMRDAIRWQAARVVAYLLELLPLAKGKFFQRLGVREVRVPWVIHPWIIDREEAEAQQLCLSGMAKLWDNQEFSLPPADQIRDFLSAHSWLVYVGEGIVFSKHDPITTSISTPSGLDPSPNYMSAAASTMKRNNLTRTATTTENLALLGAALCTNPHPPPILVCGPHGAGKSSLVREMAAMFSSSTSQSRDHLLELHVDEETDAKTLVGAYTMTDVPGEFAWKAGALTQAVRTGKWVLIEDLDTVPTEIQAALVKLLEDRVLPLGASGKMERCHPNFRLFATCTTATEGKLGAGAGKKILNSSLWRRVFVKPLPFEELQEIARMLYPTLPPSICESALAILTAVDRSGRESNINITPTPNNTDIPFQQSVISIMQMTGGRNPSVRDFFKLLSRIANGIVFERDTKYATESQRTLCMAETVDTFFAACPDREKRREVIQSIVAPIWGLTSDLAFSYLYSRRPVTRIGSDFTEIGRAKLPIVDDTSMQTESDFSETSFSLRIMESIASAVEANEPLLLVGETGGGKTTVVQHLAKRCGKDLVVQNLSLQTDSTDLLGGFRPLELQYVAQRVYQSFVDIFVATFSRKQNSKFLNFASTSLSKRDWKKLSQCFIRAGQMGLQKVRQREQNSDNSDASPSIASTPSWQRFCDAAERFERQRLACDSGLVFTFTEGALVDAIREGKWVLLDEINLASSEILQRLLGLLDDRAGSLTITERGDAIPIPRHSDFRIFAAMNPATDAGKKELHPSIRSRFTEMYVDELVDPVELRVVAARYLQAVLPPSDKPPEHSDVVVASVNIYLQCRELAEQVLVDGAGHKPRFTLRSLARALTAAKNIVVQQRIPLQRAILEGFELAIQGPLDAKSVKAVQRVLKSTFGDKADKKERDHPGRRPGKGDASDYVLIKPFWIEAGPITPIDWSEPDVSGRSKYILTPSAKINLRRLARSIASGPWPVLLEGPTSAGKTTLVEYIAARLGHRVVRINNHEHTDVQEYTGCYAPDENGNLAFQDGILVRALKRGDWVILDELNLAPSEVLEALNRLLDDNRQLYLAEINQVIKPHPSFRLFATQNPCGIYGGRKPLSRAFRNRFVELHMADIPNGEMTTILELRCACPPSHAKVLVAIMDALRQRRSKSGVFLGKDGLITPRDLLRWAERRASSKIELAQNGYMLLAERLRTPEEKAMVKEEIEKHLKVKVNLDDMYYGPQSAARLELRKMDNLPSELISKAMSSIAPTRSLLRLLNLILRAIQQREPVLLVGDTGCGKTTVVELLSALWQCNLRVINCHATTETSDLIGGLRPVRGRNAIARKMLDKLQELLLAWPDRDALKTLTLPAFVYFNPSDKVSNSDVERPSEGATRESDLPENAVSSMIEVVRNLRKSASGEVELTMESPKKKLKLAADHATDEHTKGELTAQVVSLMCELEELFRRHSALFEWADGPVAASMKSGDMLLLDELSLAEDAVLERLNSVLEPSRTLVLAEKGDDALDAEADTRIIKAHDNFKVFATMNPGGDFGKRELSPALRSRFTEIWVPPVDDMSDIELVLARSLATADDGIQSCQMLQNTLGYISWFNEICKNPATPYPGLILSLRDVLAWTRFVIKAREANENLNVWDAYCHGAALMHLDGIGLGTGLGISETSNLNHQAQQFLFKQTGTTAAVEAFFHEGSKLKFSTVNGRFGLHPFWVQTGSQSLSKTSFNFQAPTTAENAYRVLRAMQLTKPILLEGDPGVGKTSLVLALANAAGHRLVRINLSEQTDMSDLMGSDLPVPEKDSDGKMQASFKWCDGVLLTAVKNGDWVLLDELNLASQSVLEGLNSCLDYRANVFVPELGKTFECPPTFRVFGAQNPMAQGGGRKGLPRSFLNRFTKVHVSALKSSDLRTIVASKYAVLSKDLIDKMVAFNEQVHSAVAENHQFGNAGSPWEFNLRDVFRWADLLASEKVKDDPLVLARSARIIYLRRFRTQNDREQLRSMYSTVFCHDIIRNQKVILELSEKTVAIGCASLERIESEQTIHGDPFNREQPLLRSISGPMEAVARCIEMKWPCLLVGKPGSGKSNIVNTLSELCNANLMQVSLSPSSDVNELVGCFEQVDVEAEDRHALILLKHIASAYIYEYAEQGWAKDSLCYNLFQLDDFLDTHNSENKLLSRNKSLLSVASSLMESLNGAAMQNPAFNKRYGQSLAEATLHIKEGCLASSHDSHFQWVDGVLARAMTEGHWLLLENVNLCPSSVLDRLNPVMENDGELLMAECGVQKDDTSKLKHRVIKAHRNFRIFLSMDPDHGEVSRAMRNRCIEIGLLPTESLMSKRPPLDVGAYGGAFVDTLSCSWSAGLRSSIMAEQLLKGYRETCKEAGALGCEPPCVKVVSGSAAVSSSLLAQGISWSPAARMLQNIFPLKNLFFGYDCSIEKWAKSCHLLPNPSFRTEMLVYPQAANVAGQAKLLRLCLGWRQLEGSIDFFPDVSEVFQVLPSDETLASGYKRLHSLFPRGAEGTIVLRNFLLLLFLVQSHCDFEQRLKFLDGHDDPFAAAFKSMALGFGDKFYGCLENSAEGGLQKQAFGLLSMAESSRAGLMRLPDRLAESVWQSRIASKNVSQVSLSTLKVLDVSFYIQKGFLDQTAVSCSVTPALFPFFQAFDMWADLVSDQLQNSIAGSDAEVLNLFDETLLQRDRLWAFLSESPFLSGRRFLSFDDAQFIVQWTWFKKSYTRFNARFQLSNSTSAKLAKHPMSSFMRSIDASIFGDPELSRHSSPSIWRKCRHPLVPCKASQWEAIGLLRSLALECTSFETENTFEERPLLQLKDLVASRHHFLVAKKQDKMELLLALCMLHWSSTDEASKMKAKQLLFSSEGASFAIEKQWKKKQEDFFHRLDSIRIDQNINTVENMMGMDELSKLGGISESQQVGQKFSKMSDEVLYKFSRLQLSSCASAFCRDEELALLRKLCFVVLESSATIDMRERILSLIDSVRRFVDDAVSLTTWPVSDLRPFQTLIWCCEDLSQSGDQIEHLLSRLLPVMFSGALKHASEQGKSGNKTVEGKLEMPVLFDAECLEESATALVSSSLPTFGGPQRQAWVYTEELLDLVGGFALSLHPTRKAATYCSLENHRARALQAQDFVHILASASFHETCPTQCEIRYIVSETMAALGKWIDSTGLVKPINIVTIHEALQSCDKAYLENLVCQCSHSVLQELKQSVVLPLFDSVMKSWMAEARPTVCFLKDTALSRAYSGLLRFHLLLPESPLDPGRRPLAKAQLIESRLCQLRIQVASSRLSSGFQSGDFSPDLPFVRKLLARGTMLSRKRETQSKKIVERVKRAPPFVELYEESRDFAKNFCSSETVLALISLIQNAGESGSNSDVKVARERTRYWLNTASAFCERLVSYFSDYEDFILPLADAVRLLQEGIEGLIEACLPVQVKFSRQVDTVKLCLQYPMPDATSDSGCLEEAIKSIPKASRAGVNCSRALGVAMLSRLLVQKLSRGISCKMATQSCSIFDSLLEKELESSDEGVAITGTEEELEHSFRQQFPDYWSEFQSLLKSEDDAGGSVSEEEDENDEGAGLNLPMSLEQVDMLCFLHRRLFSNDFGVSDADRCWTFRASVTAADHILKSFGFPALGAGKEVGTSAHVMALSLAAPSNNDFVNRGTFQKESKDGSHFYHDPNPTEVLRATRVLDDLMARITQLLTAFPGNDVLLGIFKVADRVRKLDLHTSSVGKVMTGLEVVLKQAQDWEQHASKHVKIGQVLKDIGHTVAIWRKLELESWNSLLLSREQRFLQRARKHWVRIYKILRTHQPVPTAPDDNDEGSRLPQWSPRWAWKGMNKTATTLFDKLLDAAPTDLFELAKVMDTFMLTSALGEFRERLQLLRTFSVQLYHEARGSKATPFETLQCARLLSSMSCYYAQFVPHLSSKLDELRKPIETKLRDQMKLAKWDEQSYYALADSSEKNHRTLMRCLREYDGVLEMNVGLLLDKHLCFGIRSESSSQDEVSFSIPKGPMMFPHLKQEESKFEVFCRSSNARERVWTDTSKMNIQVGSHATSMKRYTLKMQAMLNDTNSERKSWSNMGTDLVLDFCGDIFHRINSLRHDKATRQMKERALVDLFKELKRHGYSATKWSTPKEQRQMMQQFQLPGPNEHGINDFKDHEILLQDSENYYLRFLSEISRFRSEVGAVGSKYIGRRETEMMLNFSEHGLFMMSQQRSLLSSVLTDIASLKTRLHGLAIDGEVVLRAQKVMGNLLSQSQTRCALALESLNQLVLLLKLSEPLLFDNEKKSWINNTSNKLNSHTSALGGVLAPIPSILTRRDAESVSQALGVVKAALATCIKCQEQNTLTKSLPRDAIDECCSRLEETAALLEEYIEKQHTLHPEHFPHADDDIDIVSEAVKAALLSVQEAQKVVDQDSITSKTSESGATNKGGNENDIDDVGLWKCHRNATKEWAVINIRDLNTQLDTVFSRLKESDKMTSLSGLIADLGSLCQSACALFEKRLHTLMHLCRATGKFHYILIRVFRVLVSKGYCSDESSSDDEGGNEGDAQGRSFEDKEGTGMGEGDGAEDVTDQLENEEQLLGLEGENKEQDMGDKPEKQQLDEKEAEQGMEMEGKFDGDMFDMPDNPESNENDDDDEGEEEELEREMGLEEDPNEQVVDEKMWGDSDDEDENENQADEKFEKNSSMKGERDEEQMRTKEDGEESQENQENEQNEPSSAQQPKAEPGEAEENDNASDHEVNEDLEELYEENHGIDVRQEPTASEPQDEDDEDQMQLDDDMQLDEQGGEEENAGEEEGAENALPEEEDLANEEQQADEDMLEEENDGPEVVDAAATPDVEKQNEANDGNDVEAEEEDPNEDEEPVSLPSKQEEQQHDGLGIQAADGEDACQDTGPEDKADDGGTESKDIEMDSRGQEEDKEPTGQAGAGSGASGHEGDMDREDHSESQAPNEIPNPFKNPGDAKRFWHQKLNMVDTQMEEETMDMGKEAPEQEEKASGEFEYVNEQHESTTQVLGEVAEEDAVELEQQKQKEEEGSDSQRPPENSSKQSKPEQENKQAQKQKKRDSKDMRNDELNKPTEDNGDNEGEDEEDTAAVDVNNDVEDRSEEGDSDDAEHMEDEEDDGGNRVVSDLSRLDMEEEISASQSAGGKVVEEEQVSGISSAEIVEARHKWIQIKGETNSLALRLCEKLRLVMEPLVASKLRGDYRTGKRINMKRVIGYVASGYRKDKIWLRRTKPAKRNYRVLLAVDDSESMLKCGTGETALRAMATLAVGMSQLEIGELGVASFGDDMKLLHPFNQPFTSQSGVNVTQSFSFKQARTRTALCVESAMSVLDAPGDAASVQLMFLITDGRIERDSRSALRRLIREMMERNILLAMIIVEPGVDHKSGKPRDSIINMKEVSFEKGKPKVKRFIEDYPFPYYLILDDIQALPEVLGDALRQWFEMLAQNQSS